MSLRHQTMLRVAFGIQYGSAFHTVAKIMQSPTATEIRCVCGNNADIVEHGRFFNKFLAALGKVKPSSNLK